MKVIENFTKNINTKIINIILSKDKWTISTPYTQTVIVNGITPGTVGSLNLLTTATQAVYNQVFYSDISILEITTNSVKFVANGEKPAIDLPLVLTVEE